MGDYIDRHGTVWNRLWAIVTGLTAAALGTATPVIGWLLVVSGLLVGALAAGGLDLAMALWRSHTRISAVDMSWPLDPDSPEPMAADQVGGRGPVPVPTSPSADPVVATLTSA